MIPKSGNRFSERSCSNKKLERDDDSTESHPALAAAIRVAANEPVLSPLPTMKKPARDPLPGRPTLPRTRSENPLAAPRRRGAIRHARMAETIGEAHDRVVAAKDKVRAGRIADRPPTLPLCDLAGRAWLDAGDCQ